MIDRSTTRCKLKVTSVYSDTQVRRDIVYGRCDEDVWEDISDFCFENNIPLGSEITFVLNDNLYAKFYKDRRFRIAAHMEILPASKMYVPTNNDYLHLQLI